MTTSVWKHHKMINIFISMFFHFNSFYLLTIHMFLCFSVFTSTWRTSFVNSNIWDKKEKKWFRTCKAIIQENFLSIPESFLGLWLYMFCSIFFLLLLSVIYIDISLPVFHFTPFHLITLPWKQDISLKKKRMIGHLHLILKSS